ncbi:MAG: hypothetical protein AB1411_01000 [Nitrospirota bacterium]
MPDQLEVLEEHLRMARLRRVADVTAYWLGHASLSHEEALSVIEHARGEILKLCPGKEDVFDLVLRPRFLRILDERALAQWGLADAMN